jgi:acid phosphatase (class A)
MPPPITEFKGWTIDNLAVAAVSELSAHPATQGWLHNLQPTLWDASNDAVEWELDVLEELASYRDGVMSEAITQATSIVPYFQGLVGFTDASHPQTTNLCFVALNLGTFVVMYYKQKFNRPRPSQLRPALLPVFEVPGHASFPSGHSTQSHLIARFLERVIGKKHPAYPLLQPLADRISINREVMGLHYRSDSVAGQELAQNLAKLIDQVAKYKETSGGSDKEKEAGMIGPPMIAIIMEEAESEWRAKPKTKRKRQAP